MRFEEIQKPLFCANSHMSFAISLQRTECMPPIFLMYANAVLLSVKIWTCLTLQLYLKYDFRADKMAFSSIALICFFSKELHLPPIGVFPSVAPHPYSLVLNTRGEGRLLIFRIFSYPSDLIKNPPLINFPL